MMPSRPDCPDCGEPLANPYASCSCGWRARKRGADKSCAWKGLGEQCQSDGYLSDTTTGGGPWYCRVHYARLKGLPTQQAVAVDDSQAAVDQRVNKIVPRLAGESEHDWSMRCRDWALSRKRIGRYVEREPGEDREEAA